MKKSVTISVSEDVLKRLHAIKTTKGVPISRSLEMAFVESMKNEK